MTNIVLDIDNLVVGLGKNPQSTRIIDGVSLQVARSAKPCAWSAKADRANQSRR